MKLFNLVTLAFVLWFLWFIALVHVAECEGLPPDETIKQIKTVTI